MNSSPVSLHIGPFKPFLHGRSLFANPLALRFSLFACFILLACKCHAATPNTHSSELLSPQEGDRIALEIRYGIIDRNTLRGAERWQRLDQAIKETDTLADAFFADQQLVPEQYRRLIDRMIALAARHRALDTVTLYESFVQQNRAVPAWAKKNIAGSYLELHQPKKALVLYQEVLTENADDFDANLGLFYALVETEQIDLAITHIDQYAARLPERRHLDGQYNEERLSADITADRARLYADRLQEGEERIKQRLTTVPFNTEARQSMASLALARGWTRQGERMLRRVQGADPNNPSIYADLAETQLNLQRWTEAKSNLEHAIALDAESVATLRAVQTFKLHDRYELSIESTFGKGKNSEFLGTRDGAIDSFLYSRPIADSWRFFAHQYTTQADLSSGKTDWIRYGAGAEWRWNDWRIAAETNTGSEQKAGFSATARWQANDDWTLYGTAESVSNQIPLQAVADGVYANLLSLGIDWRANESRKIAFGAAGSDFSDGNQRTAISASWFERWYSQPRWMIETTLGADATHNTLDSSVSYFNPSHAQSLWLNVAIENMPWRQYARSFRQRLALTGGMYWQANYETLPIKAIEYQHRWELDRDLSIRYSIGHSLRPYDGDVEGRTFATLGLLWLF